MQIFVDYYNWLYQTLIQYKCLKCTLSPLLTDWLNKKWTEWLNWLHRVENLFTAV